MSAWNVVGATIAVCGLAGVADKVANEEFENIGESRGRNAADAMVNSVVWGAVLYYNIKQLTK